MSNEKILVGLDKLDPEKDVHWGKDGKPSVALVKAFSGLKTLTAQEIEEARPGFTREFARAAQKLETGEGNQADSTKSGATNAAADTGAAVVKNEDVGTGPENAASLADNATAQEPIPPEATHAEAPTAARAEDNGRQAGEVNAISDLKADGRPVLIQPLSHLVIDPQNSSGVVGGAQAVQADPKGRVEGGAGAEPVGDVSSDPEAEKKALQSQLEQIDQHVDNVRAERDRILSRMDALTQASPDQDFASTNQQYLESQKRQLEQRGERTQWLQSQGVTQKVLDTIMPKGNPIDRVAAVRRR